MRPYAEKIQRVFKIATRAAWYAARQQGIYSGSPDDHRDGFIHLCARHQLAGTLTKHFKDQVDLILIEFDTDTLGGELRWERSRGGDLFPHLYAPLPTAAARAEHSLQLDQEGVPVVPKDIA